MAALASITNQKGGGTANSARRTAGKAPACACLQTRRSSRLHDVISNLSTRESRRVHMYPTEEAREAKGRPELGLGTWWPPLTRRQGRVRVH